MDHIGFNFILIRTICNVLFQVSALNFVLTNDDTGLSDLLAEVCPLPDDSNKSNHVGSFPLPDTHWINKPQVRILLYLKIP